MTQGQDKISRQTVLGETVTVGDVAVTPQSRALIVRWPRGGWVWHRPTAVLVRRDDEEQVMPIVDVTRAAQLVLFGFSLVFALLGSVTWMMTRSSSNE